jgi:hypothetical protein
MQFPLPEWVDRSKVGKLHTCSLCSSVWIFSIIYIIFGIDILPLIGLPSYPVVGGILSGGLLSFLVHLIEIGFREKFMGFTIE